MRKLFSLIFLNLILFMLVNVNIVFATDSAQMQQINQNVEQNVDKSKEVNEMGIYKMPDDLTYSDSSRIYLNNGIILFKYTDGTEQLVDMMSPDIVKNVNFDGDSDNIVISFVYNNVIINGTVLLQKSTDTIMHNTVVGTGAGDSIRGFDIKVAPKYSYLQNYDQLDIRRGILDVFYSDGSLGIVKMTDPEVVVEGFDNSVPGIQKLTVKYKGFEKKFEIEIIENHNPGLNGEIRSEYNFSEKSNNNKNNYNYNFQEYKVTRYNGNDSSNITNNKNNYNNNNINKNSVIIDNTLAKGLLPQTGGNYVFIFIIFMLLILIVVVCVKEIIIKRGIRGK